ncbi:MAG: chloramphenicol acetyltransferase [Anaerolineales bacterium]|nr:chloramphenicol acetyltransferase [Anaerolineales bacterium]
MKIVALDTWPRRKHFAVFGKLDYPHFNVCAPVDITETRTVVKEQSGSINHAIVYVLARAANELEPFRLRIRGDQVVEHETVQPSITVLSDGDLFSFCTISYCAGFARFCAAAVEMITRRESENVLEDEPGQDDLIFMTGLPWIAFTSIVHPIHMHPADSIPRIAWGKFDTRNGRVAMPLSVQVHHGLMDGIHVGTYFQHVQALFDHPAGWMRT